MTAERTQTQLLLAQNTVIPGERIILRPITFDDAADLYEYGHDPETTEFVFETHATIEESILGIGTYFMSDPIGKFAIELRSENKMIGTFDLRVNENDSKAEIGYVLNKAYQGNGYMTEAGALILDLAFNTLRLNKVFSLHDVKNPQSGAVMKRLNMTYEGTLRQDKFFKGKFCDYSYYSILKTEYH